MSDGWEGGSTRRYRKVRAGILAENRLTNAGRCCIALPGQWPVWGGMTRCRGVADCVHHTMGRKVTGDDPRYMVAACTPCNLKVGEPKVDPPPTPTTEW